MAFNKEACAECRLRCYRMHTKNKLESLSFFKILIGSRFTQLLYVPPMFAVRLTNLVGQAVRLEDASGRHWGVKVSIVNGALAFEEGWNRFVLDHSLTMGEFLVFTYTSDSHFSVAMFDVNACEKLNFSSNTFGSSRRGMRTVRKAMLPSGQYLPSNECPGSPCFAGSRKVKKPKVTENQKTSNGFDVSQVSEICTISLLNDKDGELVPHNNGQSEMTGLAEPSLKTPEPFSIQPPRVSCQCKGPSDVGPLPRDGGHVGLGISNCSPMVEAEVHYDLKEVVPSSSLVKDISVQHVDSGIPNCYSVVETEVQCDLKEVAPPARVAKNIQVNGTKLTGISAGPEESSNFSVEGNRQDIAFPDACNPCGEVIKVPNISDLPKKVIPTEDRKADRTNIAVTRRTSVAAGKKDHHTIAEKTIPRTRSQLSNARCLTFHNKDDVPANDEEQMLPTDRFEECKSDKGNTGKKLLLPEAMATNKTAALESELLVNVESSFNACVIEGAAHEKSEFKSDAHANNDKIASKEIFASQVGDGSPVKKEEMVKTGVDMDGPNILPFVTVVTTCSVMVETLRWLVLPSDFPSLLSGERRCPKEILVLHDLAARVWPAIYHEWSGFKVVGKGWEAFARANNIQVGDVCVFQFMNETEDTWCARAYKMC